MPCATAGSLPTPEQIEVAELLARLARIDLATAEKLAPDPEMDDRPVGFHAQQAVEKAVKVALTLKASTSQRHTTLNTYSD
jgi:HEPN domain-containing protein